MTGNITTQFITLFKQNFNTGLNIMGYHMTLNLMCAACDRFVKYLVRKATMVLQPEFVASK